MEKKPRKVFPSKTSIIKELREQIRRDRDRLLGEIGEKTARADFLTHLLARTEPAKHKRWQIGDELTEIG